MREFFLGQPAADEFLNVLLADQLALDGCALGHSAVFRGEGKDLVDGLEQLPGIGIGHLHFGGRVFAQFASYIAEAGRLTGYTALVGQRWIAQLAEGRDEKGSNNADR